MLKDDPPASPRPPAQSSWGGQFLPDSGPGRIAWIALFTILLVLKCLAIFHFRADSDETQHAHVVWALAHGQLQYRDFFDNHMPLFQMACIPLFRLLGEHSYILIELRFAMLPLYFACLWCVFTLAQLHFSSRAAPWVCLCAAALPKFFYTSTEFRTDDLWAALWLLSLVVASTGKFTLRRAFYFGTLLGLAFAVSLKTVLLAATIAISSAIALSLGLLLGRKAIPWTRLPLYLLVILCGAIIFPGAIVWYFHARGAFWIMYYCVVQHNIVPGLQTWNHIAFGHWIFPLSIPFLTALGILCYRQAPDHDNAIRRVLIVLTPCVYLSLLYAYWREITREDDLPYVPLLPLVAIPILLALRNAFKSPRTTASFYSLGLPAVCAVELLCVWKTNSLKTNRMQGTTRGIKDVLLLSRPNDFVMDNKGGYIFRPRPVYWVFEPVTKARIRLGLIHESLPASLIRTQTKLSYFYSEHADPGAATFITSNYMPFDRDSLDLGVAGKELGQPSPDGTFSFDVAIPQTYAMVGETGVISGFLDGARYTGPIHLGSGRHWFHRTSGGGRAAIFLADAIPHGYRPLFDESERILRLEQENVRKGMQKAGDASPLGLNTRGTQDALPWNPR